MSQKYEIIVKSLACNGLVFAIWVDSTSLNVLKSSDFFFF